MRRRFATILLATTLAILAGPAPSTAQDAPAVIRTESRVVLVDAVVTDKKGNYVRDLKQKDFRVWEDNKEQSINSFSFEAAAASPANDRKHYLVLFFDNSTSSPADQTRARDAAKKFIDTNAGPNRLMSVVEFSGGLKVAQNFTGDADRLKQVVSGVKFSSVSPNAGPAVFRSFATRSVLLALRDLAKGLATVPGRKTLVFISAGFPLDQEGYTELNATIDACNRSNVAVYPIDVRGLVAPGAENRPPQNLPGLSLPSFAESFMQTGFLQKGRGGSSSNPSSNPVSSRNPNANSPSMRSIGPMGNIGGNQQVLYALANGTGGFVIVNSNDLFAGLEKIGKEQEEYYLLGYTPSKELEPGACHTIKVKVDQGDTVRARSGYCDVKPKDILAGTPTERDLENRAKANATPTVQATMQAPFVFISPGIARVNMAMDLPASAFVFSKEKGKLQSTMNVIGIVSLPDGGVAARFSDTVKREYEDKKQVDAFHETVFHYEKQFEVASGKYTLKIVFSSGPQNFGKLELPLAVDPYDSTQFLVSSLVLSKEVHSLSSNSLGAETAILEDRVPLVASGFQVTPAATNHFKKSERGFLYGELYEPAFAGLELKDNPAVGLQMQVVEKKTGAVKLDSGLVRLDAKPQPGSPAVPFALRIDFTNMTPGSYSVRVTGIDANNHKFTRSADLELDQ